MKSKVYLKHTVLEMPITEETLTRLRQLTESPFYEDKLDDWSLMSFYIRNSEKSVEEAGDDCEFVIQEQQLASAEECWLVGKEGDSAYEKAAAPDFEHYYGWYRVIKKSTGLTLRVAASPAKIATGDEEIPYFAKLPEAEKYGDNEYTQTFGFGLRLPLLMLEWLVSPDSGKSLFQWSKEEKRMIQDGTFTVPKPTFAYYSHAFDSQDKIRAAHSILHGLYASLAHWDDRRIVTFMAGYLNIGYLYDENMLSLKSGKHELMTVWVLPQLDSSRLHFEVTLMPYYLRRLTTTVDGDTSVLSARELEDFYTAKYNTSGFRKDGGFSSWLVEDVNTRLKLTYLLNNLGSEFSRTLEVVDDVLSDPNKFNVRQKKKGLPTLTENHIKLLEKWRTTKAIYRTASELCRKSFSKGDHIINVDKPSRCLKEVKDVLGLDLTIPRQYLTTVSLKGPMGTQTFEENMDELRTKDDVFKKEVMNNSRSRFDADLKDFLNLLQTDRNDPPQTVDGNFRVAAEPAVTVESLDDMDAFKRFN